MIVKQVLRTTKETGDYIDETGREVSSSVGTHNLTELRKKLEERMLLTVNSKNRAHQALDQQQDWPSYHSTSYDDEQEN